MATTIHRQLKELSSADIVLIDEASMVSLDLFDRLLKSLGQDTHLILMGDPNQLASVEAGSILKVITESNTLSHHCFKLTQRHRIEGHEALAQLQDLCLSGDSQRFIQGLKDSGMFWEDNQRVDRLQGALIDGYQQYFKGLQRALIEASPDFQCLTAISEGVGGRRMINHLAQVETQRLGSLVSIIVTANQPGIGVFNGDIGIVIDSMTRQIRVRFDNLDQPLRKPIGPVESAWAISIHRSYDQNTNLYSFACLSQAHRSHVSSQVESMFTLRSQEPKNRSDFLHESMIDRAILQTTCRVTVLTTS